MDDTDLIGQIVVSKRGRDCGLTFVVLNSCEEEFLFITDGRLRKVEKPKKKKMKHLTYTGYRSEVLRSMLLKEQYVTNRQVREELKKFDAMKSQ